MSDKDPKNPTGVILKKEELESFVTLAESTTDRSNLLLEDHYLKRILLSGPMLSRVCELYATGTIFSDYMEKHFDIESLPEGSKLEVPVSHVQAMARIVLSIKACRDYLSYSGINVRKEDDV